jgi:hypothetical protein
MADPRDDLVERVAQIVYEAMRFDRENYTPPWQNGNSRAEDEARATAARLRAVVLEEAAKVAEAKADEWATVWRNRMKADSHMEGKSDGADDIAAAIRALISKETA